MRDGVEHDGFSFVCNVSISTDNRPFDTRQSRKEGDIPSGGTSLTLGNVRIRSQSSSKSNSGLSSLPSLSCAHSRSGSSLIGGGGAFLLARLVHLFFSFSRCLLLRLPSPSYNSAVEEIESRLSREKRLDRGRPAEAAGAMPEERRAADGGEMMPMPAIACALLRSAKDGCRTSERDVRFGEWETMLPSAPLLVGRE